MWPWEHAVFAYLLYSMYTHSVHSESPSALPTIVVVFAAVLPDLIDKPLAWEVGVVASGYAIGHSIFFTVPLLAAIGVVSHRVERPAIGHAFAVGYVSHLLGDVLPASIRRGTFATDRILWPIEVAASNDHGNLRSGIGYYLEGYLTALLTLEPTPYMLVQVVLFLLATVLWFVDGLPPFPKAVSVLAHRLRRVHSNN